MHKPLMLIALLAVGGCQTAAQTAPTPEIDPPSIAAIPDATAFAMARKAVVAKLRDPQSAQFGEPMQRRVIEGNHFVCGTVNAKNGFGGYTGRKIFIYRISSNFVVNQEDDTIGFIAVEKCKA